MPDPLIALLTFAVVAVLSWAVFLPRYGIAARVKRVLHMSRRVRLEDALKHCLHEQIEGRLATVTSVAGALEVTRHRATSVVAELERLEFVRATDEGLRLTDAGRAYATRIVRSHRLWERYLADRTAVRPGEWHARAEIAEHQLTERDANALASRMGHPLYDPHGDPIPTERGELPPVEGIALSDLPVGRLGTVIHIEDEPPESFDAIVAAGIQPLMRLRLLEASPSTIRVSVEGREDAFEPMVARNITVHPLPRDETDAPADTLTDVRPGYEGRVLRISSRCQGPQRRRLLDLGVVPGTVIQAELESAARDPIGYRIRGAVIALRRAQADLVYVTDIRRVTPANVEETHARAV